MGKALRQRRRSDPLIDAAGIASARPPRRRRRRRGAMTRLRAAVRRSFHASSAGRTLRRGIRTVSTRLYQAFGTTPQGPVRLGLLCCLIAFVTVGAVSSSHFFRTREAARTSDRSDAPSAGQVAWSSSTGADREATPRATAIPSAATLPRPIRAVWVARFHYHDAADIAEIMRNCRAIGANTVLFQVRGEATVAYPSKIEPWSREYDFADPGFDPLAIAIAEARKNDLRIEAWCNVMPGWMR